ncbi:MAG TPA: hypothetical protein VII92_02570 [Anaerolineae bacterium]
MTKRIPPKSQAIRVNGRAVANAAGAKLAAASIGCAQMRGPQCGQGNVRVMLEHIGAGECLVQMTIIDDSVTMRVVADVLDSMTRDDSGSIVDETIRATANALRTAAQLRGAGPDQKG